MRSVDKIIDDWKVEYGRIGYGKTGAFYRFIDFKIKKNLLLNLAQTLIDEGYKQEDLEDRTNINKIVNSCAPPPGVKSSRTQSNIKKSKDITNCEWAEVLKEFFHGSVSVYVPKENIPVVDTSKMVPYKNRNEVKTTEEILSEITDPKNRIVTTKIDRSNDVNWELFEELGIEPDGSEQ